MGAARFRFGHYLTPVDRQLFMAPLADYAILHLYLLAGGDTLAGLPQFLSLLLAMLAATGVVSLLAGAGPRCWWPGSSF